MKKNLLYSVPALSLIFQLSSASSCLAMNEQGQKHEQSSTTTHRSPSTSAGQEEVANISTSMSSSALSSTSSATEESLSASSSAASASSFSPSLSSSFSSYSSRGSSSSANVSTSSLTLDSMSQEERVSKGMLKDSDSSFIAEKYGIRYAGIIPDLREKLDAMTQYYKNNYEQIKRAIANFTKSAFQSSIEDVKKFASAFETEQERYGHRLTEETWLGSFHLQAGPYSQGLVKENMTSLRKAEEKFIEKMEDLQKRLQDLVIKEKNETETRDVMKKSEELVAVLRSIKPKLFSKNPYAPIITPPSCELVSAQYYLNRKSPMNWEYGGLASDYDYEFPESRSDLPDECNIIVSNGLKWLMLHRREDKKFGDDPNMQMLTIKGVKEVDGDGKIHRTTKQHLFLVRHYDFKDYNSVTLRLMDIDGSDYEYDKTSKTFVAKKQPLSTQTTSISSSRSEEEKEWVSSTSGMSSSSSSSS